MKTLGLLTVLFAAANIAAAASPSAQPSAVDKSDAAILIGIAQANMAEVEAGKMAIEKSKRDDVKEFARTMVQDHGAALAEVKTLASAKAVTLPAETDPAHKALAAKLSTLSETEFDKQYIAKAGVADHAKVRAVLKADTGKAQDPDVKALAMKMAPTAEHHLEMAKKLQATK
jgi:putative membrane protein